MTITVGGLLVAATAAPNAARATSRRTFDMTPPGSVRNPVADYGTSAPGGRRRVLLDGAPRGHLAADGGERVGAERLRGERDQLAFLACDVGVVCRADLLDFLRGKVRPLAGRNAGELRPEPAPARGQRF